MKYFLVYIVLLLFSQLTLAQTPEPIKGDNHIEVATKSDSSLYKQVGFILTDHGYTFKSDKEFGTFKTDEKPLPTYKGFLLTVNISVRQNKVRLSGILRNSATINLGGALVGDSGFPAEYRKGNLTMHRAGFLQLMDLAETIQKATPGSTVVYYRQ